MPGFPTYKASVLSLHIVDLLRIHAADLGFKATAVFYGDQSTLPESPTICVEPGQKERQHAGSPMMMDNVIRVGIIVYSTHLESEAAQKNGDKVSEDIEDFLNLRSQPSMLYDDGNQLGGNVTSGFVESIASGYQMKADRKMRANRLVYAAYTHTHLVLDDEGAKHA
jgi:hypothetical protein